MIESNFDHTLYSFEEFFLYRFSKNKYDRNDNVNPVCADSNFKQVFLFRMFLIVGQNLPNKFQSPITCQ